MACGITGDYIDQMMIASDKKSKRDSLFVCPLLFEEKEDERGDQEEVKGGTQGG